VHPPSQASHRSAGLRRQQLTAFISWSETASAHHNHAVADRVPRSVAQQSLFAGGEKLSRLVSFGRIQCSHRSEGVESTRPTAEQSSPFLTRLGGGGRRAASGPGNRLR